MPQDLVSDGSKACLCSANNNLGTNCKIVPISRMVALTSMDFARNSEPRPVVQKAVSLLIRKMLTLLSSVFHLQPLVAFPPPQAKANEVLAHERDMHKLHACLRFSATMNHGDWFPPVVSAQMGVMVAQTTGKSLYTG